MSSPALVARLRLWISSTRTRSTAGVDHDLADGVGDVGGVGAAGDRGQAEEPGELHGQLAGRALGRGGDVDDRDAVVAAGGGRGPQLVGAAELFDARWSCRWSAAPDTIRPRRALISRRLSRVSSRPCVVTSPDRRGGDDDQLGVVAACGPRRRRASSVAARPSTRFVGQQRRTPAGSASTNRRQPVSVVVGLAGARRRAVARGRSAHHHFLGLLAGVEDRQRDDLRRRPRLPRARRADAAGCRLVVGW